MQGVSFATDSGELLEAFEAIYRPVLDSSATYEIDSLTLSHKDLTIGLGRGQITFFEPVMIDSTERVFGAYFDGSFFEGKSVFQFNPPVEMERDQLKRFFGSDSLNRTIQTALLFFSSEMYETIAAACRPAEMVSQKYQHKTAGKMLKLLTKDDELEYAYETLASLIHPAQRPFFLIMTEPDKSEPVVYVFDPDRREEVRFLKEFVRVGLNFLEPVCQYSQYIDPAYYNINGLTKDRIRTDRYTIDAMISKSADFEAEAEMEFAVKIMPTQSLRLSLHPELVVDSIVDSTGTPVGFRRYIDDEEEESWPLFIFFDRPLELDETIRLKFFYHGDIIRKEMGQFFVSAGAGWYPRYGFRQPAFFTLDFKTPDKYTFLSCGKKTEEEIIDDTLRTRWRVFPPAANVSFNIGQLDRFDFTSEGAKPVEVYFSEDFHRVIGEELARGTMPVSRNMHEQVGQDIINAVRVFESYFGPYPYSRLTVSEILLRHGEAFPGFLHLGFDTWINTDSWGYDRIFRAHEVAHQWWGVGVDYETYHDQWLSEGFCEYSALMYLQAAAGNDKFLDRLKEYRNDIFSARQYVFGSGAESGPVALGYRTSTSETRGDFGLIIYKKGALVLHMLRNLLMDLQTMKEDAFQSMMKEFYGANRGTKVTTRDFQLICEKYVGGKMDWFFNQWIYRNDLPTYEFSYEIEPEAKGTFLARGRVITTGVPDDFMMYVPLEIEIDADRKAYIRLFIDSPDYEFTLPGLTVRPKKLRLNPFESVLAKVKQ